ncbi:MAG: SRPBCC domain-containing protein [Ignavibacteria bacterium]
MDNSKNKIKVEVFVRKPLEEVWEYFTNPDHIVHWNFASDDWHCPYAENQLKDGGKFKYTMASKDGKFSFDFAGEFLEVWYLKKLILKLGDDRLVRITFDQSHKGVLIKEVFEAENVYSPEQQKAGWQTILNNFKIYAESR